VTAAASTTDRAVVSFSSGKDAAFAWWVAKTTARFEIVGLLTTITAPFDRVSMHGVRRSILEAQARAAGLALWTVPIPHPCPNEAYERAMAGAVADLRARGVSHVIFGDIFLQDVRAYRERMLEGTGLTPVFPLWGRDTGELARAMIDAGFDARVVTVDPKAAPRSLAGRRFDEGFLAHLPPGVDPCGERGEFHTCVVDAPMFSAPLAVRPGPVVERDGFVFADLAPDGTSEAP